jgi:hypothetical protein
MADRSKETEARNFLKEGSGMATTHTNRNHLLDRTEEEAPSTGNPKNKESARPAEIGQIAEIVLRPMNEHEPSDLICEQQTRLAESELCSFVSAVTKLHGAEQATLSAQDWLDEFESINSSLLSTKRNWRAVTIAASARLADRLNITRNR